MALTIEDGSVVASADSFASASELATYAANYGLSIPATESAQEVLLRRAAVAMNALGWKGERVSASQALAWPRMYVIAHGYSVDSGAIPDAIKHGQMALAAEIYADDQDPPEEKTGAVIREKVDVIETEYAQARVSRAAPKYASTGHFAPYLLGNGGIAVIRA